MGRALRMDVISGGGGIAGLTLAGFLAKDGIMPQVYDAAPRLGARGLGVNLLPHATRVMAELGLLDEIARRSVETCESTFFNRFGQRIYAEPAGLRAGYDLPQFSIHRGDLRSEEHTAELQSLMRISYAVLCLKKKPLRTYRQTS